MAAVAAQQPTQEVHDDEAANGWAIEDLPATDPEGASPRSDEVHGHSMVPLPLRTEVALDYPALGLEAGDVEAVISVVAPPIPATTRAPLRLVAVLDKSGSMRGDKLGLLTQTMLFMLRNLSERDALGLVAYDIEVSVLAPLTHCTASGRRRLEAALNRLRAGTQTNLSGGLLEGLDLHRGCRSTGASAASTPMQRAKLGNTYRRLSEEEASEKQNTHFGISAPPDGAQRVHAWTMELRLENEEDIGTVQKVVYRLHETFRDQSLRSQRRRSS
jgi:hypothetical protein